MGSILGQYITAKDDYLQSSDLSNWDKKNELWEKLLNYLYKENLTSSGYPQPFFINGNPGIQKVWSGEYTDAFGTTWDSDQGYVFYDIFDYCDLDDIDMSYLEELISSYAQEYERNYWPAFYDNNVTEKEYLLCYYISTAVAYQGLTTIDDIVDYMVQQSAIIKEKINVSKSIVANFLELLDKCLPYDYEENSELYLTDITVEDYHIPSGIYSTLIRSYSQKESWEKYKKSWKEFVENKGYKVKIISSNVDTMENTFWNESIHNMIKIFAKDALSNEANSYLFENEDGKINKDYLIGSIDVTKKVYAFPVWTSGKLSTTDAYLILAIYASTSVENIIEDVKKSTGIVFTNETLAKYLTMLEYCLPYSTNSSLYKENTIQITYSTKVEEETVTKTVDCYVPNMNYALLVLNFVTKQDYPNNALGWYTYAKAEGYNPTMKEYDAITGEEVIDGDGYPFRLIDMKNADAGANFFESVYSDTLPEGLTEDDRVALASYFYVLYPWVIPWYNINGNSYSGVRSTDKLVEVLSDSTNLQFTRKQQENNWIRLLMPKYLRYVEVEDLNRNFWVIAQVVSGITAYLFNPDGPLQTLLKGLLDEITQLWENVLYLWGAAAVVSQDLSPKEVHCEVIYFNAEEFMPYLKYDDFDKIDTEMYHRHDDTSSKSYWPFVELLTTELKTKLDYLTRLYNDTYLFIIPVIRLNNYQSNYYDEEYFSFLLKYTDEDGTWKWKRLNQIMKSFCINDLPPDIGDDTSKTWKNYMYAIKKDYDSSNDGKPIYKYKSLDKADSEKYYFLGETEVDSFEVINSEQYGYILSELTVKGYDKGYWLCTGKKKQIWELTYDGTSFTVNSKNLEELSELEGTVDIKRGYYQGELCSYYCCED